MEAVRLVLSTRSRYGLRAMFDLALNYGTGPVALKTVAERQKLPEQYLEQIVIGLRRARLLRGGCAARRADTY